MTKIFADLDESTHNGLALALKELDVTVVDLVAQAHIADAVATGVTAPTALAAEANVATAVTNVNLNSVAIGVLAAKVDALTTKFNTLLTALETVEILEVS